MVSGDFSSLSLLLLKLKVETEMQTKTGVAMLDFCPRMWGMLGGCMGAGHAHRGAQECAMGSYLRGLEHELVFPLICPQLCLQIEKLCHFLCNLGMDQGGSWG